MYAILRIEHVREKPTSDEWENSWKANLIHDGKVYEFDTTDLTDEFREDDHPEYFNEALGRAAVINAVTTRQNLEICGGERYQMAYNSHDKAVHHYTYLCFAHDPED